MSTSEKWTDEYLCLCGKGKILAHVDSPDNPWSGCRCNYEIVCATCSSEWVIDGKYLYNRASHDKSASLWTQHCDIGRKIAECGRTGIDEIIADRKYSTPKEEYEFLKAMKLSDEGPIRYKRARLAGKSASSMCNARNSISWIIDNVPNPRTKADIISLIDEQDRLSKERALVLKKLAKTPLSSLTRIK